MCNHADMKAAASLLCNIEMDLSDRFTFCMAPANLRNPLGKKVFIDYATAHSNGREVPLDIYLPKLAPRTELALRDVEIKAKIINVYLWLSYRFQDTFVQQEEAIALKERVLQLVEEGLQNTAYSKENDKRVQEEKLRKERQWKERNNRNANGNNNVWNIRKKQFNR